MKLYCLGKDPNYPCFVFKFPEMNIMIDCGLSLKDLIYFMPSTRTFNNYPSMKTWMPDNLKKPELIGELKENHGAIFLDSIPEFCTPVLEMFDFSELSFILISNYHSMLALPFITEGTGFKGIVLASIHTIFFGRLLLEELARFVEDCPKENVAREWKNFTNKLPYPISNCFEPKSWKELYCSYTYNKCMAHVQAIRYDEKITVGGLTIEPVCTSLCPGAVDWAISNEKEKIIYLGSTGEVPLPSRKTPPTPLPFSNADVCILTNISRNSICKPNVMLDVLCQFVEMTLANKGNVLIPCYPTATIYEIFDCLSKYLSKQGREYVPMFFLSPVAKKALAYMKGIDVIYYDPDDPYVHIPEDHYLASTKVDGYKLFHFNDPNGEDFLAEYEKQKSLPSRIIFCGHPSLRFGDVVNFIRCWGGSSKNTMLLIDTEFQSSYGVAAFLNMDMNVVQCPLSGSVMFSQANNMLRTYKPHNVVLPDCYIDPNFNGVCSTTSDKTIVKTPCINFMPYKGGDVKKLPVTFNIAPSKNKKGKKFKTQP